VATTGKTEEPIIILLSSIHSNNNKKLLKFVDEGIKRRADCGIGPIQSLVARRTHCRFTGMAACGLAAVKPLGD